MGRSFTESCSTKINLNMILLNSIALLVVMFYTYWKLDKLNKELTNLESDIQDIHNSINSLNIEINKLKQQNKKRYYSQPKKEVIQG
jgi:peptidoglycan hydrolase CwlO-like protein